MPEFDVLLLVCSLILSRQALGTRPSEPPSSYSTRILSLNLLKTTIIMSGLSNFMQEVYVLHLCSSLIITLIVVNVF